MMSKMSKNIGAMHRRSALAVVGGVVGVAGPAEGIYLGSSKIQRAPDESPQCLDTSTLMAAHNGVGVAGVAEPYEEIHLRVPKDQRAPGESPQCLMQSSQPESALMDSQIKPNHSETQNDNFHEESFETCKGNDSCDNGDVEIMKTFLQCQLQQMGSLQNLQYSKLKGATLQGFNSLGVNSQDDLDKLKLEAGFDAAAVLDASGLELSNAWARENNPARLRIIFIMGASKDTDEAKMALHFAAQKGYLEIAKVLLHYDVNIDETAMTNAIREGKTDIVRLFLAKSVNQLDNGDERNYAWLKLAFQTQLDPWIQPCIMEELFWLMIGWNLISSWEPSGVEGWIDGTRKSLLDKLLGESATMQMLCNTLMDEGATIYKLGELFEEVQLSYCLQRKIRVLQNEIGDERKQGNACGRTVDNAKIEEINAQIRHCGRINNILNFIHKETDPEASDWKKQVRTLRTLEKDETIDKALFRQEQWRRERLIRTRLQNLEHLPPSLEESDVITMCEEKFINIEESEVKAIFQKEQRRRERLDEEQRNRLQKLWSDFQGKYYFL